MNRPLEAFKVSDLATIREAVEKMDHAGEGFICIVDVQDQVVGVLSNGDFRRAVLRGIALEQRVTMIMNTHFRFLEAGFSRSKAEELIKNTVADHIPVLDKGKMVGLVKADDFISEETVRHFKENCSIPLVIMAGGQGTRLAPFSHVLPKPLMPIGEKSVIEYIMSEFAAFGICEVIISINHKARLIKAYCEELGEPYKIRYVAEEAPLGSAGALQLMKGMIQEPFFMTNCDIMVKENYWEIYDFHQRKGFDLTIIAAAKRYVVPYGVCHIQHDGQLDRIQEKPELNMLVNTGVYIISPSVLDFVPEGKAFNMDDLITTLCQKGKNVGVFPVAEKAFVDIGQLEEYKVALDKIGAAVNMDMDRG